MSITNEVKVPYTQEKYLTLRENKAELVKFLSANLREAEIFIVMPQAECDLVAAVFDGTDVAVMLLHIGKTIMDDVLVVQGNESSLQRKIDRLESF